MEKAQKVWNDCLSVIKDNVSPRSFQTWFEPIKSVKLKNKILTLQVPSQFFYEWVEEHYVDLLVFHETCWVNTLSHSLFNGGAFLLFLKKLIKV